jgi:DNA-binding IclR family transcriptional regulator
MPSIYAVVYETIRSNPGLTPAQIAAKTGSEATSINLMIQQLVTEGRVVQTGATFSTATFAVKSQPHET